MAAISDDIVVPIVPKCGCSSIAYLSSCYNDSQIFKNVEIDNLKYSHFNELKAGLWREIDSILLKSEQLHDMKVVVIYRDPIERCISAKHTIAPNMDWETYFSEVVNTFNSTPVHLMNQHIIPQTFFYDVNKVDLFVELKDLSHFLSSIHIAPIEINKRKRDDKSYNKSILDYYSVILQELYAKDYEMINNIPESKIFK